MGKDLKETQRPTLGIAKGQHTPVAFVDVILACQQHHYDSLQRAELNPKSCALINTL